MKGIKAQLKEIGLQAEFEQKYIHSRRNKFVERIEEILKHLISIGSYYRTIEKNTIKV